MDPIKLFSDVDDRKFGVLIFTIHNYPLDATLWQELYRNLINDYEGIEFMPHLPDDIMEENVQHDTVIYIAYNPATTRFSMFDQFIELAVSKTMYNCSLATVEYDSKTKIHITISVDGYVANYIINFKRGFIPLKLPVAYPEKLES